MRRTLAAASALSADSAGAAERDPAWFERNPVRRRAWLRARGDDWRVARDPRRAGGG